MCHVFHKVYRPVMKIDIQYTVCRRQKRNLFVSHRSIDIFDEMMMLRNLREGVPKLGKHCSFFLFWTFLADWAISFTF